jgi:hypothetical protein
MMVVIVLIFFLMMIVILQFLKTSGERVSGWKPDHYVLCTTYKIKATLQAILHPIIAERYKPTTYLTSMLNHITSDLSTKIAEKLAVRDVRVSIALY